MIRLHIATIVSFLIFFIPQISSAKDPCIECHKAKTPAIVKAWEASSHSKKNIGCAGCHGNDIEANHKGTVIVDAVKCGSCHLKPLSEHRLSKHAISLKAGRGCTRNMPTSEEQEKSCAFCHERGSTKPLIDTECAMFLSQKPEMQRQGCDSCHKVENRCDTCHTKHATDLSHAKSPAVCGSCHMGPDHAQYEMWETSPHGALFKSGGEKAGPTCATCHMSNGLHNVSKGVATGLPNSETEIKKRERKFMIDICSSCHTKNLSARSLDDADAIETQSRGLVEEAQAVVEGLYNDGLLMPMPNERPPHPLFGGALITGPHMLYENLSKVESLYFKMKQFYYMNAFKGAFHQNPDYTHWYGNAPLKLTLSEIKSEAILLRKIGVIEKRLENFISPSDAKNDEAGELKKNLRELKDKRLNNKISEKEYIEMKTRLLKNVGL
ncbi:MAG: hypothetical protein EPN22_06095 [Nitrospirae bacterium]|nr:MAG: hypothetical protein EPN22_06095 [Nitrospirota bacterium]